MGTRRQGVGKCNSLPFVTDAVLGKAFVAAVVTLVAVAGVCPLADGQSTGSLVVAVSDSSGAAIPDVRLQLTNEATGLSRAAPSSREGTYTFDVLPPGVYTLRAERGGFSTVVIAGISVRVDTVSHQDVNLKVASAQEQVNVQAQTAQVIVDSASLGEVVGTQTITDLPLNGRDFLQLATLTAGVSPPVKPVGGINPFQSVAQGFSALRPTLVVSVSGVRESSEDFLIDGVPSRNQFYGAVSLQPPVDSIAEFKIQRGYFSPEFGQPAVVNVVTKSGGNALHGTLWEFFRNDVLDARSFFDQQKLPWRQNQFGANIGGHLIHDKLFWFADYEGTRERQFRQQFATVPTAAERAGDFTGMATIYDPATYNPGTGTKQPFPNNIIPSNRISTFSTLYDRFLPMPNSPTLAAEGNANLVGQITETLNADKWSVKLDYVASQKDSMFGRFSFQNSGDIITSLFPTQGQTSPLDSRNAALGWTHVFSPNLVNQFRAGMDISSQAQGGPLPEANAQDWPTYLGLKNLNKIPVCNAAPSVSILGFTTGGVANGNCIIPSSVIKLFSDNLSLIRARHNLTLGGVFTRQYFRDISSLGALGSFSFTGAYTGTGFADYLLGNPFVAIGAQPASPVYLLGYEAEVYANDDFKITRKLTLNYGVRWQLSPPMLEKYNHLGVFDPATGDIRVAGQDGNSRRLLTTFYHDFAPRVGFAYAPVENWSIRSSYGIFYDRPPGNDLVWNSIKWPFQNSSAFVGDPNVPSINISTLFPVNPPGQPAATGTSLFNYADRKGDPYLQQWTLSIQHSLPGAVLLEAAYVGSRGNRLSKRMDDNVAPLPQPGDTRPVQERRPYPQWSFILDDKGVGISKYNGLQLTLRKNYSHGLTVLGGYTWSRSMDTDSFDSRASRNYYAAYNDYGRSTFDLRNRLTASISYDLPSGAHWSPVTKRLFGGWQAAGIVTLQSGIPLMPLEPFDQSNTGVTVGWARPNQICNGNLPPSQRKPSEWFNTSCFVQAAPNTYGDAGTNFLDGPGYSDYDLSAIKNFKVRERAEIQFRAEFFNALNHPNFGVPGYERGLPGFGQITSAYPGRNIQFALKVAF